MNIGIALGEASGIVVLDVDPRNGGDDTLQSLIAKHGPLPDTATALTGGGGTHYVFRYTNGRVRSPGAGLDALSNGKLIVVEPSTHASGRAYAWEASADPLDGAAIAEPPAWLLDGLPLPRPLKLVGITAPVPTAIGYLDPARIADLRRALPHLDADNYQVWIGVGQALHSTDAPEAFELWDTWSQHSEKYQPGDCEKKWCTFRNGGGLNVESIFAWARQAGWSGVPALPVVVAEAAPDEAHLQIEAATPRVPAELLRVPGMLGDFCDHMTATAHKVQRVLSVNAALAAGAAIMGRKYACDAVRTNIQIVGVGPTGCGKDHGRQAIKQLFHEAGLRALLGGEEIKSGSAVYARVAQTPNVLFQLDEFGLMMRTLTGKSAASYQAEILSAFMKMFSSSGAVLPGPEYANQKERPRIDIEYPCIHVHATTTGETFWPALSSREVLSGYLNRMIVTETENPDPERQYPQRSLAGMPAGLVAWAQALHAADGKGVGNLSGIGPASPVAVRLQPVAVAIYRDCVNEIDKRARGLRGSSGLDALYSRAPEYVIKFAQIVAGSLNPEKVEVNEEAMRWACAFVTYWTARLVESVSGNVADSEHEARVQAVMKYVNKAGACGITRRELAHRCRKFRALRGYEQDDILESIVANGEAHRATRKTATKDAMVWVAGPGA